MKCFPRSALALLLCTALLCGCGAAVESPSEIPGHAPDAQNAAAGAKQVTVSTVDELLASLASDTVITLKAGEYILSEASDYGKSTQNPAYSWRDTQVDGYELQLQGLHNTSLIAEGEVTLAALPRYANVLSLVNCSDVSLLGLALGHTEEKGQCAGGVLKLSGVENCSIAGASLFGCGTVGLAASDCSNIRLTDSRIYDCSISAADLSQSQNVWIDNCEIDHNNNFSPLFSIRNCDGAAITNSRIHDNAARSLLESSYSRQVYFGGNQVRGNRFDEGLFALSAEAAAVESCSFADNGDAPWIAESELPLSFAPPLLWPVDAQGKELNAEALSRMPYQAVSPWSYVPQEAPKPEAAADGAIHVSTVDEFLAALAPQASIFLEPGDYDLSTAADYGAYGSEAYYWKDTRVDGPQLVIRDCDGLRISGSGIDSTRILALPRYAEVLAFEDCSDVQLQDFTAGHIEEPGTCIGGVLYFSSCEDLAVERCSLFGCGVYGISCFEVENMEVTDTEIYDCSRGDLYFRNSRNISIVNCDLHDNGPQRITRDCTNVTLDGENISKEAEREAPQLFEQPRLSVLFGNQEIKDDFLLHAGDPPLTLKASLTNGSGKISWESEDPEALKLTPNDDGSECSVEILQPLKGGTTITVSCPELSVSIRLTAYLVE